ncbi:ABEC4 enzyme, partial [Alectura lathami]|nr:ABEC4 enzyme [Alectura lathami]
EKIFREYLTNQGTVVKPYCWQTQSQTCAKCPYHIRTGEEARVLFAEFHRAFGFPLRTANLPSHHFLFYELRSFSGTVVQKGHATGCADQDSHPESMLFEADGYLDSVTRAHKNIRCIILYSNYSPCNEAYHCCVSKIYNFLLKHAAVSLCLYFSWLYHAEDGFPSAMWNREALRSLASLWPRVTLHWLPMGTSRHLLSSFVYGVPGSALCRLASPPGITLADEQDPHQINNSAGVRSCFRTVLPQAVLGKPAVQQSPKTFPFSRPAFQQPSQGTKGSLSPPVTQSHLLLFPGLFLPFRREHFHPRPKNIVRHLKMPRELSNQTCNSEMLPARK